VAFDHSLFFMPVHTLYTVYTLPVYLLYVIVIVTVTVGGVLLATLL